MVPVEYDAESALPLVLAACKPLCPTAPETPLPGVAQTVRVVSFLREPLSFVLPCSGLWFADAWPWLFPPHGTAKWNLLWPFLFQPIFSLVYLVLSRVRPARLSVEQAVFQPSNQTPPARALQQS